MTHSAPIGHGKAFNHVGNTISVVQHTEVQN